jgi:hypothetical protein
LLSAVVDVSAGTTRRGQCFVALGLNRGGLTTLLAVQTFLSGYPSSSAPLSYPPGGVTSSVDGPGAILSVNLANPGAGVDFAVIVPPGARWQLMTLHATLTTAIAVANRQVNWIVDDGVNVLYEITDQTVQAASLAHTYTLAADGIDRAAVLTVHHDPLPTPLFLFQGWRVRPATLSIQAADQWGAIWVAVQEWIEL